MTYSIISIIVAAGSGTRMQNTTPKAFLPLKDGKPILACTLSALAQHHLLNDFVIVVNPDHRHLMPRITQDNVKAAICDGGKRRQDSVKAGLDYISQHYPPESKAISHVLIHDAARPFINLDLLNRLIAQSQSAPDAAIIAGIQPRDTIKHIADDGTITTLPRHQLLNIQTPQIFPFHALHHLHQHSITQNFTDDFTDDAALFEQAHKKIIAIKGEASNIKITYPQDLPI
ncbi:MAG: 2-C-methyl-D-erythritol 4-phosphate cytidylyltransferase [Alphaproteobacteria bacterium]|nr:2-C-methyl-D-erythritol 4-phosphate cytidylyltransferase [Alphaproteobacteria bacterium]